MIEGQKIKGLLKGKRVLFVTTKNLDYIRNTQEISLVETCAAKSRVIGFTDKSYIKRIIKAYWSLLREKRKEYDVVFVGFAPQLVVPVWHWKFKKSLLVIDFFISMYDTFACDRRLVGKNSAAARFLHWIDERTIKSADHIIADTKAHGAFFLSEFGAVPDKLEVLYLVADTNIYDPVKYNTVTSDGRVSVLYFGSILPLQGIDVILTAVDLLRKNKDVVFTIVGPVSAKSDSGEIKKADFKNARFIDWLSQEELAGEIARTDLCLAGHFSAEIEKAKRTIPGKAYIYEAMNKPMILGDNSANRELFQEDDRHLYVEMGNAQALADKIDMFSRKMISQKEKSNE